mmetsp:Transcript_42183/g.48712  ORF Transcript_42183/g.48712 Transcript_42183/m.48712 type:complete len:466 (-) Transcript_42183:66-1463(-)
MTRIIIFLLSLTILLVLSPPSHSFSIRYNSAGQPRLCSVVTASLNGFTRIGFGQVSPNNDGKGNKEVVVTAKSNRDVLRGKFQLISVSLKNTQSPWLTMNLLDIHGENLQFGYTPILFLLLSTILFRSPSLILLFPLIRIILMDQRQRILMMEYLNSQSNEYKALISIISFTIMFRYQFLLILFLFSGTLQNQRIRMMLAEYLNSEYIRRTTKTMIRSLQRLKRSLWSLVGGSLCQFNYTLILNDDNIAQSSLIRLFTKSIVQSFMANSALPVAAAAGDTANQLLKEVEDQATMRPDNSSSNNNALSIWKQNESSSFELSKFLSATSFDVSGDPTFGKNGYVCLPCVAVLPNNQGNLSFALRTKLRALSRSKRNNHITNGLEFLPPDCRVDVDAALPSNTNNWTKKFLPSVVWLPIGSLGMVLPLGKNTSIEKIIMKDRGCEFQGKVLLFQEDDDSTKIIIRNTN